MAAASPTGNWSRCGPDRVKNWPVPNKPQWLPFRRWAAYLGLARPVGTNGLIPDASEALIRRLPALQPGDYDIGDFVGRCAQAVPVLDGGALWREPEAPTGRSPASCPAGCPSRCCNWRLTGS